MEKKVTKEIKKQMNNPSNKDERSDEDKLSDATRENMFKIFMFYSLNMEDIHFDKDYALEKCKLLKENEMCGQCALSREGECLKDKWVKLYNDENYEGLRRKHEKLLDDKDETTG